MSTTDTETTPARRGLPRRLIVAALAAALVAAMALDTTVVRVGSEEDLREQAFDADSFGQAEFPRIRDLVIEKAPDAVTLATELAADRNAAIAAYGTSGGTFPVLTVAFTGTALEGASGIFGVDVDGMPEGTAIRVQTGPAINGTDLRDVPGDIQFGMFTNQIEYQDVGSAINRAMSAEVLSDLDRDALTGKTVTVVGAFTLINPANWLVTPVRFEVSE
ncbi:DUF2291 domain-containing protein [Histidinibacterium lentulum]|uniref:DUF2291 domain-containing protein n=1 Tax=Histidinibacterium lentulum TaxID=2480588 RepID=A0A3N2R7L8_9RHOB|nr:DUF2291 domain-containing protein [Histidinibacterium lentulum]ROU03469.1 DUF2291 domain-containing protein [Histidinibacterium lentulum]